MSTTEADRLIAWCTLSLCCLGVLTNLLSIVVFTHRSMRSPINVLLAGLSVCDLSLSVFSIPTLVLPTALTLDDDWWRFAVAYSVVYLYPLTTMAQSASVWTFLAIAFERYIAVCHPLKARWCTVERSYKTLAVVSVLAVLYNSVRFFEYRLDAEVHVEHYFKNASCAPLYMPVYYVGMYLVTHFIVPFFILIFVNVLIVLTIVSAKRQRLSLGRRQKTEHTTTIMMVTIILMFVVCNTLPFVINFLEATERSIFDDNSFGHLLNGISNLLVMVNASTTAFIYYTCSQRYRRLLRRLVCHRLLQTLTFHWICCPQLAERHSRSTCYQDISSTGFTEVNGRERPAPAADRKVRFQSRFIPA